MTTASTVYLPGKPILDERLLPANVFATGYTDEQINMIVDEKVRCSEIKSIPEAQPNYPSFSIIMGSTSQYECKPKSDKLLRGKPEGYFLG
ncbi:hypothetical protein K1719_041086 [Acacia pycnantha]|nr:hypothetical protein K1719_041086 [Acacia pycnantha]